ncbi:unnamed protein product [Closterium sp. Naga37s-1]|nr:unnamed protein product [Closterium sp. Naga37s-1]
MPRGEWEQWRRRRNAPRRVGAVAAAAKCPAASGVVAAEAKCPAASGSRGGGGEMPRGEWEQRRRRRNAPRRVGAVAAAAKCPAASGSSGGGGEMPRGEWSSGGGGEMPRGEWEQWRRRRNAPRRVGAVAAAAKCPAASGNSGGGGEMPRKEEKRCVGRRTALAVSPRPQQQCSFTASWAAARTGAPLLAVSLQSSPLGSSSVWTCISTGLPQKLLQLRPSCLCSLQLVTNRNPLSIPFQFLCVDLHSHGDSTAASRRLVPHSTLAEVPPQQHLSAMPFPFPSKLPSHSPYFLCVDLRCHGASTAASRHLTPYSVHSAAKDVLHLNSAAPAGFCLLGLVLLFLGATACAVTAASWHLTPHSVLGAEQEAMGHGAALRMHVLEDPGHWAGAVRLRGVSRCDARGLHGHWGMGKGCMLG